MKLLYWNARGVAILETRLVLRNLILYNKPEFIFISEPMITLESFPRMFWYNLDLKVFAVNSRGDLAPNLWCMCPSSINPVIIASTCQHVSFSVLCNNQSFFISAIYASTSDRARRILWHDLLQLQHDNRGPWCCIGDFNCILGAHEHRGSRLPSRIACEEFRNWTEAGSLTHIDTRGAEFTWNNARRGTNHTERRLYRVVCNEEWQTFWSSSVCYTLIRNRYDHYPIMFCMQKDNVTYSPSFKFMKIWTSHPDCKEVVAKSWDIQVAGCPMFILAQKLKILKKELMTWNKEKFGDVNQKVNEVVKKLEAVQAQIFSSGISDELLEREKSVQVELSKAFHFEEEYWREKSRINWHSHGDRNTAFFHRVTKIKHASNRISVLKNENSVLDKTDEIENHILDFYKNLFSTDNSCMDNGLIEEVIHPLMSEEDNRMLTKIPSWIEIKDVVFVMNAEGAPGPDGFGGFFFQKYWV